MMCLRFCALRVRGSRRFRFRARRAGRARVQGRQSVGVKGRRRVRRRRRHSLDGSLGGSLRGHAALAVRGARGEARARGGARAVIVVVVDHRLRSSRGRDGAEMDARSRSASTLARTERDDSKRRAWTRRADGRILSEEARRTGGRDARASRERGGSAGLTGGEVRYESSSSISISEKSSESCDVSADMVTLRLPNERIVERSCEASRSGRRGARSRTGVARTGRRALSCESSGGRLRDRELRRRRGDVERRARVCARGATRAVVHGKISANSQVFTCFSRIQKRSALKCLSSHELREIPIRHSVREGSLMDFENERELGERRHRLRF